MSGRHKQARQKQEPDQRVGLWVLSDVAPTGAYICTVSFEGDRTWTLSRDQATAYAHTALTAAAHARFDAALFRLFHEHLGLSWQVVGGEIASLRSERPPVDDTATAPLRFVPGVNPKGVPFMHIHLDGEPVGQISCDQLEDHARAVIQASATVDLDAGLHRHLRAMDVPDNLARTLVHTLGTWRI